MAQHSPVASKKEFVINDSANDLIRSAKALDAKKLDLCRREIYEVPTVLLDLTKLEFLYLEGNLLQTLPEMFFSCLTNLKWLDLRRCNLVDLPQSIGESRSLRSLLLDDNKLKALPAELGLVSTLSGLHVAGNPIEFPPSNIIEQGTQVILAFLRKNLSQRTREELDADIGEDIDREEASTLRGRDRALSSSRVPASPTVSSVKLPQIVSPQAPVVLVDGEKSDLGTDNEGSLNLASEKQFHRTSVNRKSPKKSSSKARKAVKKGETVKEGEITEIFRPSKEKDPNRKPSKSPKKTSPKHRKKKNRDVTNDTSTESINVFKDNSENPEIFDVGQEAIIDEKSAIMMRRQDTVGLNEKIKEIIEEEKTKILKVQALIKPASDSQTQTKRPLALKIEDFKKDDMVVMRVSNKHYIPGQPCLGKVVSLPDAAGLVLLHYYSGSYDGAWRPMMSRSSPYLRRVPASMIVYTFTLGEDGRMSPETVKGVKAAIDEE